MLCELVRNHCGLHFDETSRFLVEKRVEKRVRELDLGTFSEYHYHLRRGEHGDTELSHLIDALTTNETYFFRERSQLRALVDEILPELCLERRHGQVDRPVSIWSAGCSSGEEPLSVVMSALESGLVPGRDFRVYGSDISRRMLSRARRGVYRETSLRDTPAELRRRYFQEKDGEWALSDEIRSHVDFVHLNLLDPAKLALLGRMDVILCRNVIIYFDASTKERVIDSFYEKLRPGGHLLLGHSESLINLSTAFTLRHLKSDLVYRRPVPGEEIEDPWHRVARIAADSVPEESR